MDATETIYQWLTETEVGKEAHFRAGQLTDEEMKNRDQDKAVLPYPWKIGEQLGRMSPFSLPYLDQVDAGRLQDMLREYAYEIYPNI